MFSRMFAPHRFKPLKAKAMIEALLKEQLTGVTYDPSATTQLTNTLAAAIKTEMQSTQP